VESLDFEKVYSKIILCGEHSVLRGGLAVVAPLKLHSLSYKVEKANSPFELIYSKDSEAYEILVEGTFEKAFQMLSLDRESVKAKIHLESLVPLSKGLGGSAAVSVFVARSLAQLGFFSKEKIFSFAVELENMFHGESSGVDVAGCLSDKPQTYKRGEPPRAINNFENRFLFGLSDSTQRGDTEDCILKVLELKKKNKKLFYHLDGEMNKASHKVVVGLEKGDLNILSTAFEKALDIFSLWKLVSPEMDTLVSDLKDSGALAAKPTGSGDGGFILSLWDSKDKALATDRCDSVFEI
jgi:mevalonate kinase